MSGQRCSGVHRTQMQWIDTDASGIYHNSTVIRLVEAAEAQLMTARGVRGFTPCAPRAHYEVDFETPLVFGQAVETTVWLDRVGATSMGFSFEVWGEPYDDRLRRRAAFGRYVAVHVGADADPGALSAVPWPAAWVEALTAPA
ncbi:acyl-CoA thioesterase [Nocardioides acrostichi]|uniref:Acyl-CoA thioesterase n=1 Tax=Nocardioides acrostichi TaxID=2784339 RepID=A0A930UWH0_9ACTN|nr:hotdog domain-containing protein [Nocardioides acrostichi]MBF4161426.1 acyl-CoA thioesterase [Nocardioides acrostichi]